MTDEVFAEGDALLHARCARAQRRLRKGHAEARLGAEVMVVRFVLELASLVHRPSGEDARQPMHILLRVSAFDAHRVQLHQLAGIVLVHPPLGTPHLVQVVQHGGTAHGGTDQGADRCEGQRTNRHQIMKRLETAEHPQVHVKVVGPELHHALLKLPLAQNCALGHVTLVGIQDVRPQRVGCLVNQRVPGRQRFKIGKPTRQVLLAGAVVDRFPGQLLLEIRRVPQPLNARHLGRRDAQRNATKQPQFR